MSSDGNDGNGVGAVGAVGSGTYEAAYGVGDGAPPAGGRDGGDGAAGAPVQEWLGLEGEQQQQQQPGGLEWGREGMEWTDVILLASILSQHLGPLLVRKVGQNRKLTLICMTVCTIYLFDRMYYLFV
jgi:hypothetical protein